MSRPAAKLFIKETRWTNVNTPRIQNFYTNIYLKNKVNTISFLLCRVDITHLNLSQTKPAYYARAGYVFRTYFLDRLVSPPTCSPSIRPEINNRLKDCCVKANESTNQQETIISNCAKRELTTCTHHRQIRNSLWGVFRLPEEVLVHLKIKDT